MSAENAQHRPDDNSWNTLHGPGPDDTYWTTDNVGEAAPGVLSPLQWSLLETGGDRVMRRVAYRMGAFSRRDVRDYPQIFRPFFGRVAFRVDYMAMLGDRMPGANGKDAVLGLLGRAPESMRFEPTRRRYPMIALKLPYAMLSSPRLVRRHTAATDTWWRDRIARLPGMDLPGTKQVLAEAAQRYENMLVLHTVCVFAVVQPLLTALTKLVDEAGVGDVGELSGTGGAEMAIIADLWAASRN